MTTAILMRHAKTVYKMGTFVGATDLPLSEGGVEQARQVGKELKGEGISRIYCSRLKRAVRTAREVGKVLGLEPEPHMELNESDFGIFEGLRLKEVEERYPEILGKSRSDAWNYRIPKGESFREVAERAGRFLRETVRENQGRTLLFVTHLDVMRCVLVYLGLGKEEDIRNVYYPNASRVYLKHDGKRFVIERMAGVEDG